MISLWVKFDFKKYNCLFVWVFGLRLHEFIHISDDDLYGSAPWMGTLRHVTHENMVSKTIKPTPKFKKYPDEDAPNPFKGMQGKIKAKYN